MGPTFNATTWSLIGNLKSYKVMRQDNSILHMAARTGKGHTIKQNNLLICLKICLELSPFKTKLDLKNIVE